MHWRPSEPDISTIQRKSQTIQMSMLRRILGKTTYDRLTSINISDTSNLTYINMWIIIERKILRNEIYTSRMDYTKLKRIETIKHEYGVQGSYGERAGE